MSLLCGRRRLASGLDQFFETRRRCLPVPSAVPCRVRSEGRPGFSIRAHSKHRGGRPRGLCLGNLLEVPPVPSLRHPSALRSMQSIIGLKMIRQDVVPTDSTLQREESTVKHHGVSNSLRCRGLGVDWSGTVLFCSAEDRYSKIIFLAR